MNKYYHNLICFVLGIMLACFAQNLYVKKCLNKNIDLVKKSFAIFGAGDTNTIVSHYHAKNYIQYSDGKVLNYDDLVKHVDYLKSILQSPVEIIYDTIVAQGDNVCTAHRAKAVKKDGSLVEIKVLALHKIKDGKIVLTDELTHVLAGSSDDQDMGSKH